jgi:DNA-binding CsgD family transcriptional regulator
MTAYITSVGAYLPGEPIGNDDLEEYIGTIPGSDRVRRRMLEANGIEKRHYAIDRGGRTLMLNEELAERAIRQALTNRGIVRLFKAGVDGYVVKTTEGFELEKQIDTALAGGRPVSRYVAGHLLKIDEVAGTQSELESLTPREREVVTLIARGFKYREAAEELGMSQKTLETHMKHVFDKLGVASRSEVTRLAFETGFIQPGDFV